MVGSQPLVGNGLALWESEIAFIRPPAAPPPLNRVHALPSPNRILLPAPHPLTCPLAGLLPSHLPCRPPTPSHGLQCGSFPVDGLEVKQHAPEDEISSKGAYHIKKAHTTHYRHYR